MANIYLTNSFSLIVGILVVLFEYFVIIPIRNKTIAEKKEILSNSAIRSNIENHKNWLFFNTTLSSSIRGFIYLICFLTLIFSSIKIIDLYNVFIETLPSEASQSFVLGPYSNYLLLASLYAVLIVFVVWIPSTGIREKNEYYELSRLLLLFILLLPILSIGISLIYCIAVFVMHEVLLFVLRPIGGMFFCVYIDTAVYNYLRNSERLSKTVVGTPAPK